MTYKVKYNVSQMGFGGYSCHFEHAGKKYFADLRCTYDNGNECMIFLEGEWSGLYCRDCIPVTKDQLISCIEEFIQKLEEEMK